MSQSKPGAGTGFWMDLGRFLVEVAATAIVMAWSWGVAYLFVRMVS